MKLSESSRVLFTGDSITDAGRHRPIGEDMKGRLGNGYVSLIASILEAWKPGHLYRIQNTGIAGDTVMDLQTRWTEDVMAHNPDWLSLMVGINDCSRAFNRPLIRELQVPLDAYRKTLNTLIESTRSSLQGAILMSPFLIDSSFRDPLRIALIDYSWAVREIATAHDCIYIDTQAVFDKALKNLYASRLSPDSVHPNQAGHMMLAKAWLRAIDFDWNS